MLESSSAVHQLGDIGQSTQYLPISWQISQSWPYGLVQRINVMVEMKYLVQNKQSLHYFFVYAFSDLLKVDHQELVLGSCSQ